jgi:hypothetical protein
MATEKEIVTQRGASMIVRLGLLLVFLAFTSGAPAALAQNVVEGKVSSKSPVLLLDGYSYEVRPGVDSAVGKVWREHGLIMYVEFCCGFGNAADRVGPDQLVWKHEQGINGLKAVFVLTKSRELIVSFPQSSTNFRARVSSSSDAAEMLLMIFTYNPQTGYPSQPGTVQPH